MLNKLPDKFTTITFKGTGSYKTAASKIALMETLLGANQHKKSLPDKELQDHEFATSDKQNKLVAQIEAHFNRETCSNQALKEAANEFVKFLFITPMTNERQVIACKSHATIKALNSSFLKSLLVTQDSFCRDTILNEITNGVINFEHLRTAGANIRFHTVSISDNSICFVLKHKIEC